MTSTINTNTRLVDDPTDEGELYIQDETVTVYSHGGVVIAGLGSVVYAHPGVTVDIETGGTVHLAPGAFLLEDLPGALEHGDITVCDWIPTPTTRGDHR